MSALTKVILITVFIYLSSLTLAQNDTLHSDKLSNHLVTIKLNGSWGFYQMGKLKDTYLAVGDIETSRGRIINKRSSEKPGNGFEYGAAINVLLGTKWAIGVEANYFSDGYELIIYDNALFESGSRFITSISSRSMTIELVGIFYPFTMKRSLSPFFQLGAGYGWLEMDNSQLWDLRLQTTDKSPVITISGGIEISWPSKRVMSMFELGLRWLQYSKFDSTVIQEESGGEDISAVEKEFFDKGNVNFSGIFIRAGLMIGL